MTSDSLDAFFIDVLPDLVSGYVSRPEQGLLAHDIANVLSEKSVGVFEAGTGIGKTLSYLVPALLHPGKVIVSTGTKNLQDQLRLKDIPQLQAQFPRKKVALLKGRANYLCQYRLKKNLALGHDNRFHSELLEVRAWLPQTRTGDVTEIIDPEQAPRLAAAVTSNRDNCLGNGCPDFDTCSLYRARAIAQEADLLVVNHHLLFSDLVRQEEATTRILPEVDAIILDEAHQVPSISRNFFSQSVSSGQLTGLLQDVAAEFRLLGNDDPHALEILGKAGRVIESLKNAMLDSEEVSFDSWVQNDRASYLHSVDQHLDELRQVLVRSAERSDGLKQCAARCADLMDRFALTTEALPVVSDFGEALNGDSGKDGDHTVARDDETVHWIERRANGYTVHISPVSVGADLRRLITGYPSGWVFTSATLTTNKQFDHYFEQMGMTGEFEPASKARYESPFNYPDSVKGFIPKVSVNPSDESFTRQLVRSVLPIIQGNTGGTFFLFTSHRALRIAAEMLEVSDKTVLVQGSASKTRLIERFVKTPDALLLGTMSFWEGVDVKGNDLNCLILDKLPFPNINDPVFAAESELVDSKGKDSFSELSLPRMLLLLKQGFGRLIRSENDRGLFVLGDPRVTSMPYGAAVIGNLPNIPWLETADSAKDWISQSNQHAEAIK